MTGKSSDPLDQLLRDEVEKLSQEALVNSGAVSQPRMDAVANLKKLVDIRQSIKTAEAAPAVPRWAAPVLLAGALAIASLLLFIHVPKTEVELDIRASEIGLRLASETVFLEGADLTGLGVSRVQEASIRRTPDWPGLELTAAAGESFNLQLTPIDKSQSAAITLSAIDAKAGTRVWIQPSGSPRALRVSLDGDEADIQASLLGKVRVIGTRLQPQTVEFNVPRSAEFRANKSVVALDLNVADVAALHVAPQIHIDRLSLYRVKQLGSEEHAVSSVISGSLYFGALNGLEEKLRAGQELRLDDLDGHIRNVVLAQDSLVLQLSASAAKVQTGSYENTRNLMPTWLDWLRARHGLVLLWGTAFYLFGIVSAALRWLKKPSPFI